MGARKRGWKVARKHERARAPNGPSGVNGIARMQQRVRASSVLVSINGRAQNGCAHGSGSHALMGAFGARERGRENRSPMREGVRADQPIFKFK